MTITSRLASRVGADSIIMEADLMRSYAADEAPWVEAGEPKVVIRAKSVDDVVAVLEEATEHSVPVVARGAGSGLSGGATAVDGCIVLSLIDMDRILEIDVQDQVAVVQPGVINSDLSRAVLDRGMWYPPDPASYEFSTLGGNIATNAGGLCCVKYGVTQDYILGLQVVLADGTVLRTGRRTLKGVAGYNLTSLFVGSEGTLGIVTEATLRLKSSPPARATVVAVFPKLHLCGAAVIEIFRAGLDPVLVELMDQTTLRAVDEWKGMQIGHGAAALLLVQLDERAISLEKAQTRMSDLLEMAGASYVVHSSDPGEAEMLLTARRLAYPALERLGMTLLDDVAVPRGRIIELLKRIEEVAIEYDLLIGTFGHAGDGNMHPTIVLDPTDEHQHKRAQAAFNSIISNVLDLGGTITGEHGVGSLKIPYLEDEIGPEGLRVQRALKQSLDPKGILNPGKILAL